MRCISLTLLLLFLITYTASPLIYAQTVKGGVSLSGPVQTTQRHALLIGNQSYRGAFKPLKNPINDVELIAKTLEKLDFIVDVHHNLNYTKMSKTIKRFRNTLKDTQGTGLFYYAGHGMQVEGENYLIPTDANPKEPMRLLMKPSISRMYSTPYETPVTLP